MKYNSDYIEGDTSDSELSYQLFNFPLCSGKIIKLYLKNLGFNYEEKKRKMN